MQYDDRTALLVVDIQNDFTDPRGSLYVDGGEKIVDGVNRQIERAHRAGALAVYTQDWHPPDAPHFQKDGGVCPVHCVRDSWGAEFHPRLRIRGDVVRKGSSGEDGYSGFSVRDPLSSETRATELETLLRRHSIEKVAIAGIATDYCVKETALNALDR